MKLIIALLISLSVAVAAQAELKIRLRARSENIRVQQILDKEFRAILGEVLDVTIVNEGPVDEVVLVNGLAANDHQIAYSKVVLDMDSSLMAARDSVREIDIDKLKETLKAREVSGTVAYSTVSTCDAGEDSVGESVRAVLRGVNSISFQSLREALLKYSPLSNAPKVPGDDTTTGTPKVTGGDAKPIIE